MDIQKSTRLKNMCGAFDAAVPMIKLFTPEEGRNSVATFQRLDESAVRPPTMCGTKTLNYGCPVQS